MSGIAGIVAFGRERFNPPDLAAMLTHAEGRGRDGMDQWLGDNVGLGHLHLNLAPESQGERQPLVREGLVITASARLDNRAAILARLLDAAVAIPPSASDAELILAAYREWGTTCTDHLLGDFAFAIWDSTRKGLFAARDPMGLRPLYYCYARNTLLIASEVRQIRAVPGYSSSVREAALAWHLASAIAPEDWTFFSDIAVLPAAHSLWCDGHELRVWRNWQLSPQEPLNYADDQEYIDHFREVFQAAVRARLNSVRPVAVWLSGGLDSGSVASMAGWLRAHEPETSWPVLHSHSWRFDRLTQCDERHVSSHIVREYALLATEFPAEDLAPFAPAAVRVTHPDEPLIQVYSPLLEASLQCARNQGIGLILSGFRGDPLSESGDFDYLELLMKGHWYSILQDFIRLRRHAPHWSMRRTLYNRFPRPLALSLLNHPQLRKAMRTLAGWSGRSSLLKMAQKSGSEPSWLEPTLLRKLGIQELNSAQAPRLAGLTGLARKHRHQAIFFPGYFRAAVEQERHNAQFGIGYADPWSDRRLTELILRFPARMISRVGEEKRISRRAMRGIMPEEARLQARKIVPTPVFERMLRHDARDAILDLFTDSQLAKQGYVSENVLLAAYHRYLSGDHREEADFWPTITAELWLRAQETRHETT